MFYKVEKVEALEKYKLLIHFESGELRTFDVTRLFTLNENFNMLVEIAGLFEQAKVDPGGYGVSWNDHIDISCNDLYFDGIPVN